MVNEFVNQFHAAANALTHAENHRARARHDLGHDLLPLLAELILVLRDNRHRTVLVWKTRQLRVKL